MKKHGLRLLLTLCLATAFAVALGAVPAATESPPWYEMETAGDAYEFPITPEKTPEEWGKLRWRSARSRRRFSKPCPPRDSSKPALPILSWAI